jgi:pyridoxamine 5'-phosphate oxidase family protein
MAPTQGIFTEGELTYLTSERRLARIATVGPGGMPHVVPVGWTYNAAEESLDVGGARLEQTKKYRDVLQSGKAAVVIDDIASLDPWRVRGIEVRGRAIAITEPGPLIRIYPQRVISWGIESDQLGERNARDVRPG